MQIFENLAKSFVDFDITGENRSFVKELIIEYNKSRLLYYKELTPTKQTLDELADTLTNHALLDRTGNKDFITLSMNLFWVFARKINSERTCHILQNLTLYLSI